MKKILLTSILFLMFTVISQGQISRPPDRIYRNCSPLERAEVIVNSDGSISINPCPGKSLMINGVPIGGGGGLSGIGTASKIARFFDPTTLEDSSISDNGTVTTFGATLENIFSNPFRHGGSQNSNYIFQIDKSAWSPSAFSTLGWFNATLNANPSGSYGIFAGLTKNGTASNFANAGAFQIINNVASSQALTGVNANVINNSTLTSVTNAGNFINNTNGAGASSGNDTYGISASTTNSGGATISRATGGRFIVQNFSGTISEARGVTIGHWTGSATTSYGLYFDSTIDIGTSSRFAIYSLSTSDSFLSGNIRLANNKFFQGTTTGAVAKNLIGVNASDEISAGVSGSAFRITGGTSGRASGLFNGVSARFGDISGVGNSTTIVIDDAVKSISLSGASDTLLNLEGTGKTVVFGDVNSANNSTTVSLDDSSRTIISNSNFVQTSINGTANTLCIGDCTISNNGTRITIDENNERITPNASGITPGGVVFTDNTLGHLQSQTLSNGQLLVGSTGANPQATTLTSGNGVTVTNGAGSITLNADTKVLNSQFTQIGNVGTGEDDLMSYTIPASTLSADGMSVRWRSGGNFAANANGKRIRGYIDGNLFIDTTSVATNGGSWGTECEVMRRSSTTAILTCIFTLIDGVGASINAPITTQANATWANNVIIKWTAEATSDDDVTQGLNKIIWFKN